MDGKKKKFSMVILRDFQTGRREFSMDQIDSLLEMYSEKSLYPMVRKIHIRNKPYCEACGNDNLDEMEVHHIIPIKVDKSKYLDLNNLITLCKDLTQNKCHLKIGHLGDYVRRWNPDAKKDAEKFRTMLNILKTFKNWFQNEFYNEIKTKNKTT